MKKYYPVLVFVVALMSAILLNRSISLMNTIASSSTLRTIALGDSYTIGQGVKTSERWPNQLVKDLRADGIPVRLVANPSRTGWTTKQLIEKELPLVKKHRAQFATVLIGVNDWVQGVSEEVFRQRFARILDELPKLMSAPAKILVITIPDYSRTPQGGLYGPPEVNEAGIRRFNEIIRQESEKRSLPVVDIFSLSQKESAKSEGIAEDGLHPSGKQYKAWEELIFPVARKLLSGSRRNEGGT
jgi:lysophospholipase L1-like esterase